VASIAIPASDSATGAITSTSFRRALQLVWHDRWGRTALVFLGLLTLVSIAAPWLAPHDPSQPLDPIALKGVPPSTRHWMGTDPTSRDVLSRLLVGSRISLAVAALSALLSAVVGLLYGGVAGFAGGRVEGFLMRLVDALLAIPRILLLLTVLALWDAVSTTSLALLLGLTGWFAVARLARIEAALARTREFVVASRALGTSPLGVFVRHVLPHATGQVLVSTTLAVGQVIVLEAGLSYLGYGVPEPQPTWGNIIRDGRETIATTWWLILFPGAALVSTALAVNTVADRLRAAMNPRQLPAP